VLKKWFKDGPVLSPEEKHSLFKEIRDACQVGTDGWSDCWLYPDKNSSGYGMKWLGGKAYATSRIMLALATGESLSIPFDACHKVAICPYRNCCNPAHLEWKNHSTNCADREAHKRDNLEMFSFWENHAWIDGVFHIGQMDPAHPKAKASKEHSQGCSEAPYMVAQSDITSCLSADSVSI